jgi:hypothetical protein
VYLFLFSKFLFPLGLSFLLSFAFLEKRLGDEDLVLCWDSAVMSVRISKQLGKQSTFQWPSSTFCLQRGIKLEYLLVVAEIVAVTNPQENEYRLTLLLKYKRPAESQV